MLIFSARRALVGVLGITVAAAGTPAVASAASEFPRTTFLLSKSVTGGFPDGPSRNPAASHDQRIGRILAFESDATNLVANDINNATDVFVVRRAGQWGQNGTPWQAGPIELASVGLNGEAANGPSRQPSLDGDSHHVPHCVAFISEASNLVADDTNNVADAFVRDLRTGTTTRVSVGSNGQQANGPTLDISIDGACERVAFTSQASNLALRATKRKAWKRAVTSQTPTASKQVYVRFIAGGGHDRHFNGLTVLASASGQGNAGNRDSWDPAFARSGKSVVFTSDATNLTRGDGNNVSDVYQRRIVRRYKHTGHGKGVQQMQFSTRLVSATSSGRSGNGPSGNADASDDGRYVAFETDADNLLAGDTNGVTDISEADLAGKHPRQVWVSKSKATSIGNGPSNNPSISGAGEFVLFDSEATNLKEGPRLANDANGMRDMFLWNRPTGNVSLESRASDRGYLPLASGHPATSSRGNYVPFVTANTEVDLPLLGQLGAIPEPSVDLIYVRYLGPK